MAVKGTTAKYEVTNKIIEAFGEDFIGEQDKKLYVWANDGDGARVQIAISLTCPKFQVNTVRADEGINFDELDSTSAIGASTFKPAEISQEEINNIQALMDKLGL